MEAQIRTVSECNYWLLVALALEMAKGTDGLDTCTCGGAESGWPDGFCRHCLLAAAEGALTILIAMDLVQWRLLAARDSEPVDWDCSWLRQVRVEEDERVPPRRLLEVLDAAGYRWGWRPLGGVREGSR